jgi:hypothetical protein
MKTNSRSAIARSINRSLHGLLFGILIAASGTVEVQRNNVWTPIAAGAQINAGERVRTGAGSSATLDLGSGTMITLNQSSEIQVHQAPDSNVRTYTADARSFYQGESFQSYPTYYLSPYLCVNPPNGAATPPVPPIPPAPPKR